MDQLSQMLMERKLLDHHCHCGIPSVAFMSIAIVAFHQLHLCPYHLLLPWPLWHYINVDFCIVFLPLWHCIRCFFLGNQAHCSLPPWHCIISMNISFNKGNPYTTIYFSIYLVRFDCKSIIFKEMLLPIVSTCFYCSQTVKSFH